VASSDQAEGDRPDGMSAEYPVFAYTYQSERSVEWGWEGAVSKSGKNRLS